jgi:chitin synthase
MTTTYDTEGSFLNNMFNSSFISDLFDYVYIGLIVMAIIISLTTPVDRGISYFKFLMAFFGVLLLITMSGIIYYLVE